jgi:hypothetical protein
MDRELGTDEGAGDHCRRIRPEAKAQVRNQHLDDVPETAACSPDAATSPRITTN